MSGRDQATCGDAELQGRGTPDTPHNPSSRLIPVSRGTKAPASVGAPFLLHDGTKRFRNLGDVGGDARRIIGEDSYALCPFVTVSLRVLCDVESAQADLATIEDFWSASGIARYQGRVASNGDN